MAKMTVEPVLGSEGDETEQGGVDDVDISV